jgi:hypothetical protein
MKKILIIFSLVLFLNKYVEAQCPPGAFAYQSLYPQCPSGCGVLLLGWPEGVLVNIYGGSPLIIVSNAIISGTLGGGGTGDAFTCVPCNIPLVYASAIPGASGGCVIATIGIVPVKLTNFMVNISGTNSCEIKWSSSQETEPVKYIIQHSNNGRDYADIATINGLQQAINKYAYTDLAINNGTQFYRVKVAELSGLIFYSAVVAIKSDDKFGFSVFPNPATRDFKVSVAPQFLPAVLELYNAQGIRVVADKTVLQTTTISNYLSKGIYTLKVTGNNNISIAKKIMVN